MAEPRVSLIIPCFNAAAYVAEAIHSALSQSRPPDEVVVVDDGSGDESVAVVGRFGATVRSLRQANQGSSVARNNGIANSRGDLIAFLDADDLWPRDSLARRLDLLRSDGRLDYAFGGVETFRQDGTASVRPSMAGRMAGAMLVRRAAFERVGRFDSAFRIGQVIDWVARANAAGCVAGDTGTIVLRRRIHETNTVLDRRKAGPEYLRVLRAAVARSRGAA
jgi:glycosyltransferase involved in cell wall biosynthesis